MSANFSYYFIVKVIRSNAYFLNAGKNSMTNQNNNYISKGCLRMNGVHWLAFIDYDLNRELLGEFKSLWRYPVCPDSTKPSKDGPMEDEPQNILLKRPRGFGT